MEQKFKMHFKKPEIKILLGNYDQLQNDENIIFNIYIKLFLE